MTMVWTPDRIEAPVGRRNADTLLDHDARRRIRDAFAKASSDLKVVRPRSAGLCL